ncbi:NAD-dependent epimerase/dehydratase family protein [Pseudomonas fluvialis]|nr:NAD(P)-dependent oxidoreductase [Pseudomonas pharmacofabricae]
MHSTFPLSPVSDVVQSALLRIPVMDSLACGLSGKHLLLTGGTGFFGKWLLALLYKLEQQGLDISVTVVSRDPERFLSRHPEYRLCPWVHWLACDIRNSLSLRGRPIDLVLHAATDTSQHAHAQPLALFDTVVCGVRQVLDIAVRHGARRILLTGSGAQYGALHLGRAAAEDSPSACDCTFVGSAYSEAKRVQELMAVIYAKEFSIEPILTRCFTFAGPGLPPDGHFAFGNFVKDALYRDAIVIKSRGLSMRSYLHGADLAAWLLFLLLYGRPGEAYNVGSDSVISISELAQRIKMRLAPAKKLICMGAETASESYYVPNIVKARALGLAPWSSLDESIDDTARWLKSQV